MWNSNGNAIRMVEGEYGVDLPLTINGVTLTANDELRLAIKQDGQTVLEKTYAEIVDNTINVRLTEAESETLPTGKYLYSLAWFQDGVFLCYLIEKAPFEVVDAA